MEVCAGPHGLNHSDVCEQDNCGKWFENASSFLASTQQEL